MGIILPQLDTAIRGYTGCQNIIFEEVSPSELTSSIAPDAVAAQLPDLQMGILLDADATSENVKGNVIGFMMVSFGRKKMELAPLLLQILNNMDSQGLLRREGKAVCLVLCNDAQDIIFYAKEGLGGGGWMDASDSLCEEDICEIMERRP